jgi:hypothetical protein
VNDLALGCAAVGHGEMVMPAATLCAKLTHNDRAQLLSHITLTVSLRTLAHARIGASGTYARSRRLGGASWQLRVSMAGLLTNEEIAELTASAMSVCRTPPSSDANTLPSTAESEAA